MIVPAALAEDASERLQDATTVLKELMNTPDQGIPHELIHDAHCAVIIPGAKKVAFGIGGRYGRGFAICRDDNNRGWGAPAAVRMEGGSIGWQIGGAEMDIVMLVMDEKGKKSLLDSKFTLDASAGVAAGPVGRTATAGTDAKFRAGILAWSRQRGAYAGLSVGGSTLRNDLDENKELYGREVTNKEVLTGAVKPTAAAKPLIAVLSSFSRREEGTRARDVKK
jgi:lipid-binding SYLF domain-containing protein